MCGEIPRLGNARVAATTLDELAKLIVRRVGHAVDFPVSCSSAFPEAARYSPLRVQIAISPHKESACTLRHLVNAGARREHHAVPGKAASHNEPGAASPALRRAWRPQPSPAKSRQGVLQRCRAISARSQSECASGMPMRRTIAGARGGGHHPGWLTRWCGGSRWPPWTPWSGGCVRSGWRLGRNRDRDRRGRRGASPRRLPHRGDTRL
jgi:hypothetical protein